MLPTPRAVENRHQALLYHHGSPPVTPCEDRETEVQGYRGQGINDRMEMKTPGSGKVVWAEFTKPDLSSGTREQTSHSFISSLIHSLS